MVVVEWAFVKDEFLASVETASLDDLDAVLLRNGHNAVHIAGVTEIVNGHDRPCLGCDLALDIVGVDAESSVILALWQLKALLGIDLQRNIDVTGSLMDYVHALDKSYDISQLNLENNSTLKQLDMQEQMLEHAVKITKLANVPSLLK